MDNSKYALQRNVCDPKIVLNLSNTHQKNARVWEGILNYDEGKVF